MMNPEFWESLEKKLIWQKDCTEELTEADFDIGGSYVVSSPIGAYRETGRINDSRYGYRFSVEHPDRPHLMVVVYPDDRKRMMCIQDGYSYDLSFGLILGGDFENSGTMKTAYNFFWPRACDECVLVSSLYASEPAAVSSITVYELSALPDALLRETSGMRTFGVQYEDPCNVGTSEGCQDFYTWMDRSIAFMKLTGQNRLVYPVNWYHGPTVPVKTQPGGRTNTVVTVENGVRRFYTRSVNDDFPDWLDVLLTKFDREKLHFTGSLTLMRLGNLMKKMNLDEAAVRSGADTCNMVLYNGKLQGSLNDWTVIYNPIIYPEYAAAGGDPERFSFAYGERKTSDIRVPIFNPLHPEVRRQVLAYFGELAARYAHHPSFEGLSVNFWHGTLLWFGSLLAGYDDICADLFEKDTKIHIPVLADDPERFEKRYAWLTKQKKEEWAAWRCRKVHDLLCEIRDTMCAVRADLKLTVNLWNETTHCYHSGIGGYPTSRLAADAQFGVGMTNETMYRYGGIDFSLYENERNLSLCVERDSGRDAGMRADTPYPGRTLTDPAFLETPMYEHLSRLPDSEAFHFDCWEERWGQHTVFPCSEEDRKSLDLIEHLPDYRPDFVFRENCTYADDTEHRYFYDTELRITSLLPPEPYFTEQLTADLALHDALSVTSGGLYLNKSHAAEQLRFAMEYRRLPAKRFTDVPGVFDPVCMRYLNDGGKTWVYLVNREPYAVRVSFTCGEQKETADLAPFALKTFVYDRNAVPAGVVVSVPEKQKDAYREWAADILSALDRVRGSGVPYEAGIEKIRQEISTALSNGRYAKLRHLLRSYVAASAEADRRRKDSI